MSKRTSFSDFRATTPAPVVAEAADAPLPVLHDPEGDDHHDDDDSGIPALFATIHFKSDQRPDGFSAKDMWDMNNAANSHLPHLQQEWPYEDEHGEKLKEGHSHPGEQ